MSTPCPTLTPRLVSPSYQRRILSMRLCPTLVHCYLLFQSEKKPEYEVISKLCSQGHFFFPRENLGIMRLATFNRCSIGHFLFHCKCMRLTLSNLGCLFSGTKLFPTIPPLWRPWGPKYVARCLHWHDGREKLLPSQINPLTEITSIHI